MTDINTDIHVQLPYRAPEFQIEETPNVICVQPFGCLPNHITTGKGVMKELRSCYCRANISTLDYDPGTMKVNQLNRIKLLMATALRRRNCNHKLR
ncbi:MAG: hypothetical protein LBK82_16175 [Planctomycetaceae bacterium]|jgi:predicted nucleotide-binding protein (sugar kinase/HSP70/actin superfamily)|nr:hypothetical protein [Planctomycetaceae bacterium]